MRLAFGIDEIAAKWVAGKLGVEVERGARALAVLDGPRIIGAVAYQSYRGCDIEMLCASESRRWLSRDFLGHFFGYPFVQLGVRRVTAIVDKRNKHARQFTERLGWRLEGVVREALDGRDACIYGMLRRECKWVISNGQEIRTVSARSA